MAHPVTSTDHREGRRTCSRCRLPRRTRRACPSGAHVTPRSGPARFAPGPCDDDAPPRRPAATTAGGTTRPVAILRSAARRRPRVRRIRAEFCWSEPRTRSGTITRFDMVIRACRGRSRTGPCAVARSNLAARLTSQPVRRSGLPASCGLVQAPASRICQRPRPRSAPMPAAGYPVPDDWRRAGDHGARRDRRHDRWSAAGGPVRLARPGTCRGSGGHDRHPVLRFGWADGAGAGTSAGGGAWWRVAVGHLGR